VLSIDVEDWFHIVHDAAPDPSEWTRQPSRVEPALRRLLDLLEEGGARATCFFLGWVGEHHPGLVRETAERGHEVASHGLAHRLVHRMGPREFLEDARRSREILEQAGGTPVVGYRAASFSVGARTPWFHEALAEAGYRYDSSVFPAAREHGGESGARRDPHVVPTARGPMAEFPLSVTDVLGLSLCFFGGGYLRLFPYPVIRRAALRVADEGRPVIFYAHPREVDPAHPRLRLPLRRRFQSYVNLHTTERKLRRVVADFRLQRFDQLPGDAGTA
jgi:polysaccharide deacetylase family protein (PEP-CTERM system associated)